MTEHVPGALHLDGPALRRSGRPLAETLATAIEDAIATGAVAAGSRLPTVRALASDLDVSPATVSLAYDHLRRRGRTAGTVGRGTYVAAASARVPPAHPPSASEGQARGAAPPRPAPAAPWRRRMMLGSAQRLHAAHPGAVDCASGSPDSGLLPVEALRRAGAAVLGELSAGDLQYAGPEPIPELAAAVCVQVARSGIDAQPGWVAVGGSALQLVDLALRAAARRGGWSAPLVAVEEPGYATVLDAVDRLGWPMTGVAVDGHGAVPESLEAALRGGASIVLLTPRVHNPTGAAWSRERRDALAAVLAAHPGTVAVEDDHAADIARTPLRSLLADERLRADVVHLRSFSKAYAPDLRVAAAVAEPSLRALINEEKAYVDGWTSHLAQRILARLLEHPGLSEVHAHAAAEYARRRDAAAGALYEGGLEDAGGSVVPAMDGTNLWVRLPAGADEAAVLDRAAALGVVGTPGEPFRIRPGRAAAVRLTISAVDVDGAAAAAAALARAVRDTAGGPVSRAMT